MYLLDRLTLLGKFAVIATIATLMLLIPTGLYVDYAWATLKQTRTEATGLAPARELVELARVSARHRGLSNGLLAGDAGSAGPRTAAATELAARAKSAVAAIQALDAPTLTTRITQIADESLALTDAVGTNRVGIADSFARHSRLVEAQLGLLYDIGVHTQLVLHPLASGYFLQDAALLHLPLLSELLGRLRGTGMGLLARGRVEPNERERLDALRARIDHVAASAYRALDNAARAEPAVAQALGEPLEAARRAYAGLGTLLDDAFAGGRATTTPPAQWWAQATAVLDRQHAVADAALLALRADIDGHVASQTTLLAAALFALSLMGTGSAALIWTMARRSARAIERSIALADAVAAGDLAQADLQADSDARDEAARVTVAVSRMAARLASVVGSVRNNADRVAVASAQIAQGNHDLSSRTESQAGAIQQTASAMEELRETVANSADNAREADRVAKEASGVAARGGEAVGGLVATMTQIHDSSKRIADIITTIDGIAFQTNILALNAAVEAARAGEQGRGFAVVAGEVRALAQRSAQAAAEVRKLIADSVDRVEAGSRQGAEVVATITEVVGAIDRVARLVGAISIASAEQADGIAQVGDAVVAMDRGTQQNAALVEQSTAAADGLRRQAEDLQRTVSTFRLHAA